ncbi:MAG: 1-(5-phosphoribosyl)-5-[(5-phosphoribosylamino)methylideneamino]imidazole-4-carboxamide isomerase [Spirochaetia bacterium]|jgi:phosphoribosylformimino-5-aminoimidazole carboxamide ribotide isomerase|nr:1-(5-phosphoribosyl)-5-[(5-phosphoribosylamino)methylideneamino]imidazole-4-carboxamide isomerase [Spirochaetia bacterium]
MLVIPAIDIRGGRCVRLLQGDPEKETVYSDSPLDTAKRFEDAGAPLIHVVDLDGAFAGSPVNMEIIFKIAKGISIPIETGGGIRKRESVEAYIDAGINRVILGSVLLDSGAEELVRSYPKNIIAGIDAKEGMVAVKGWKSISALSAGEAIKKVMDFGIKEIIHTDISTDGMLAGPNTQACSRILSAFPGIRLIASGGISSVEDLRALSKLPVYGAITGKAVYDGRIDLRKAFAEFG